MWFWLHRFKFRKIEQFIKCMKIKFSNDLYTQTSLTLIHLMKWTINFKKLIDEGIFGNCQCCNKIVEISFWNINGAKGKCSSSMLFKQMIRCGFCHVFIQMYCRPKSKNWPQEIKSFRYQYFIKWTSRFNT